MMYSVHIIYKYVNPPTLNYIYSITYNYSSLFKAAFFIKGTFTESRVYSIRRAVK